MKNHFELLGLAPAFALEPAQLDRAYRDIQSRIHPDRFAHAGESERRASMQWATQVNEAYRTLKSPVQRAKYLLALNGVDVAFETNTAMPPDFLVEQMELRENLESARDVDSLDLLKADLLNQKRTLEAKIAECIDGRHDYRSASDLVRKLMFLEKFGEDIGAAYEALDA
ncbi:MAG TPA: Fe-S protein assembly co-chaperone HscB [Burkholderiales bacterium]|nr:Fe-S protein assembly co-chaperone HscB [Burkholderiales bacterium]